MLSWHLRGNVLGKIFQERLIFHAVNFWMGDSLMRKCPQVFLGILLGDFSWENVCGNSLWWVSGFHMSVHVAVVI